MKKEHKMVYPLRISIVSALILFSIIMGIGINRIDVLVDKEQLEIKNDYLEFQNKLNEFFVAVQSINTGIDAYINEDEMFSEDLRNIYFENITKNRHELIAGFSVIEGTTVKYVYPNGLDYTRAGDNFIGSARAEKIEGIVRTKMIPVIERISSVQHGDHLVFHMPLRKGDEFYGMLNFYIKPTVESYVESIYKSDTSMHVQINNELETIHFGNVEIPDSNPLEFVLENDIGEWIIHAAPEAGWTDYLTPSIIYTLITLVGTTIFARFIYLSAEKYNLAQYDADMSFDNSITDKLTGINNRVYLEQVLKSEFAQSDRAESDLSLIFFDIDKFKDINDTFGHAVGDNILKSLVKNVSRKIREGDIFTRWGGDEFILVLPDTSLSEAKVVADKIHIAALEGDYGLDINITISLGVAIREKNEYYSSVFRRLDQALYEAKKRGRNQVVVAKYDPNQVDLKIPWLDSWKCGNNVIDKEHQMLTIHANRLIELYSRKK
jgi:diguanylate cyclase (GGDEF)-like protein